MKSSAKEWKAKWKTTGQTFTHLLLNGGKLHVDDQQHDTFLNEYANAIARGSTEHVVETKTPIFRLFIDFDFSPPPSPDIVTAAIQSACKVASYYFDVDSRAVVLAKDAETPGKIGRHLTWDNVFVDAQTAAAYRLHLVARLEDACPDVSWKVVVDAAVFAGAGLRMPWSRKRDAPGVYVPTHVCTVDVLEEIPPIKKAADIRAWIRRTSIRAPGATATPSCIVTTGPPDAKESTADAPRSQAVSLTECAPALAAFQATLPVPFKDQHFTGMHRFGDFCVVLRSSSKRCGNKKFAEHRTSTVYFVVLKKGIAYQRCYCRKDELRDSGITCTDYVGQPWTLPQGVIDAFWPPPPKPFVDMLAILERTRPAPKKRRRG